MLVPLLYNGAYVLVEYECEMTTDVPVICSVKMRKMKQEKIEVKKI